MESNSPFRPAGATYAIAAAASAPTAIQIPGGSGDTMIYVVNSGTVPIFLSVGATQLAATANAIIPLAGVPATCLAVAPGAYKTFTLTPNLWYSAVASSAATVYVTPGWGI